MLVLIQRRRLKTLVLQAVNEASGQDPAEFAVNRFNKRLGFFAGGTAGALVVGVWWLFALAAYIWSCTATLEITRMFDETYLTSISATTTMREVVRLHSEALITRSMIGITGIPTLIVTLLLMDQMILCPRTRLLDQVRRQVLARHPDHATTAAAQQEVLRRAQASWSWMAFYFNWLWLLVKGLPRYALLFLAAQVLYGVLVTVLTARGILPSRIPPALSLNMAPTAWRMFWLPALSTIAQFLPLYILAMFLAARAHGWWAGRVRT